MLSYFSRCCYMLQQGLPVADVCFYYGDDAPNLVATRRIGPDSKRLDGDTCAHCGRPNPAPADALGTGYDYDVIDSEVIQHTLEFKDGRLDAAAWRELSPSSSCPNARTCRCPCWRNSRNSCSDGATLLGPKPSRDVTLTDYPAPRRTTPSHRRPDLGHGRGRGNSNAPTAKAGSISDRKRVREILQQQGLGPDFAYTSPGQFRRPRLHPPPHCGIRTFTSSAIRKMEDAEADCVFRVASTKGATVVCRHRRDPGLSGAENVCRRREVEAPPAARRLGLRRLRRQCAETNMPPVTHRTPPKPPNAWKSPGPWEVSFPPNLGAPPSHVFDKLVSWTDVPEDGIKYFSGTATYQKEFEAPASLLAQGGRIELDLGSCATSPKST